MCLDHRSGVLDGAQADQLVRLARSHDCALVLLREPGSYLVRGTPIIEVHDHPSHPGWVWVDGYHRWDGHRYVWVHGR